MNNKIDLVLGIHCHQPVGNFEHVFEDAYQKSYLPFVKVLQKHPKIKVVFHYSGVLLQWFKKNHPEFIDLLKQVIVSNNCEILGGGFYEPILITLSEEDRISQINLLSNFIKNNFDYDVKGIWLAERVWEQGLAKTIFNAGIDYTLVDDNHFMRAGLKPEDVHGYFTTEEGGNLINIFPISERLRYLVPFKQVSECIDFLKHKKDKGEDLEILVDDGEKFGNWPGTNKWVYEEGWLENFFKALEDNPWINLVTLKEAHEKHLPRGLIYLPPGSYKEMIEWSDGFWRNFFIKYPESNSLHKKMLMISEKIKSAKGSIKENAYRKIEDQLFSGQCNDVYWHGIFGGLYLNYLRSSLYSCLIRAQSMLEVETKKKEKDWVSAEEIDIDKDGKKEIILENKDIGLYLDPYEGGTLFELDLKKEPFVNLCDNLTRRPESYHKKIKEAVIPADNSASQSIHESLKVKKEGLEKLLAYDAYRRVSLIDHFIAEDLSLLNFRDSYPGSHFVKYPYIPKIRKDSKKIEIELNAQDQSISLKKTISLAPNTGSFPVSYEIKNNSDKDINQIFAVEFNFSLLACDADNRFYEIPGVNLKNNKLNALDEIQDVSEIRVKDLWQQIQLGFNFSKKSRVWMFPIYTVSSSESGMEQNYQHSTLVFAWKLNIPKKSIWGIDIKCEINKIGA